VPGRGCYVCPTVECIEVALKQKGLARALKKNAVVTPSKDELLRRLEIKG
jgi:predicted RNA-binding protein YlxR (DUF448 family)